MSLDTEPAHYQEEMAEQPQGSCFPALWLSCPSYKNGDNNSIYTSSRCLRDSTVGYIESAQCVTDLDKQKKLVKVGLRWALSDLGI